MGDDKPTTPRRSGDDRDMDGVETDLELHHGRDLMVAGSPSKRQPLPICRLPSSSGWRLCRKRYGTASSPVSRREASDGGRDRPCCQVCPYAGGVGAGVSGGCSCAGGNGAVGGSGVTGPMSLADVMASALHGAAGSRQSDPVIPRSPPLWYGPAIQQLQHNPPALVRVVYTTIRVAREAGLDRLGQEQQAVEAVMTVRPDMPRKDAMNLVWRV